MLHILNNGTHCGTVINDTGDITVVLESPSPGHGPSCVTEDLLRHLQEAGPRLAAVLIVYPQHLPTDKKAVPLRDLRTGWSRVERELNTFAPQTRRVLLMCSGALLHVAVGKVPGLDQMHGTLFEVNGRVLVPTWTLDNYKLTHLRPWMDRDVARLLKLTRPAGPLPYQEQVPDWKADTLVIDLETSGLDYTKSHITTLGLQWSDTQRSLITDPPVIEYVLKKIAKRPPDNIVFHNWAFDGLFMTEEFRNATYGKIRDTMLLAKARGELVSGLKHLCNVHLAAPGCYAWFTQQSAQQGYDDPAYVCEDLDATWRLFKLWRGEKRPVVELMERATTMTIAQTLAGTAVDTKRLEKLAEDGEKNVLRLREELTARYGVDPGSQELAAVLHEQGYALSKKTATGKDSLTEEVLEDLGLVDIIEYRKAVKLDSAFIGKIRNLLRPDGTIPHHQTLLAARTGRTSMTRFNHQQLPKKGPGKGIIVSRFPGGRIGNCDLKTAEVVVSAWLSLDENLGAALMSSDMHRDNAARGFGIQPESVTDDQRFQAKALIFRSIFGGSPQNDVQKKVHKFMTREFRKLFQWIDAQKIEGQTKLQVTDPLGKVTNMRDKFDYSGKWACGRLGINAPVQGTSSHVAIWLTLRVWELLREIGARSLCLFGVHDSFLVDIAPGEDIIVIAVIQKAFRDLQESIFGTLFPMMKTLPMRGEIQIGDSWADCKNAPVILCSSLALPSTEDLF